MSCKNCGSPSNKIETTRYKPAKDMGCNNGCGGEREYNMDICKCCLLVDRDIRIKEVRWCQFCKALICKACENDYAKRVKAFFINLAV